MKKFSISSFTKSVWRTQFLSKVCTGMNVTNEDYTVFETSELAFGMYNHHHSLVESSHE